jgi:hypothetical protein
MEKIDYREMRRKHISDQDLVELSLDKVIALIERAESFAKNAKKSLVDGSRVPVGKDFGAAMNAKLEAIMLEVYDAFIEEDDEMIIGPIPKPKPDQ